MRVDSESLAFVTAETSSYIPPDKSQSKYEDHKGENLTNKCDMAGPALSRNPRVRHPKRPPAFDNGPQIWCNNFRAVWYAKLETVLVE